jgi:hypothetical protein
MKPSKLTCLLTLLVLANNHPAAEEHPAPLTASSNTLNLRTDVNPALTYWQAFAARPEFTPEEQKLWEKHWDAIPLGEEFAPLVEQLDPSFRLFRRAVQCTQPCDWGYDFADGPELLLPGLAKAKNTAQQAVFRARYFLERGREDDAVQDLLAAFVLGRHASTDGTLISALVQIAVENIVADSVAMNFHYFGSESLKRLSDGIEAAPARGTIARSTQFEKEALYSWFSRKVREIRARNGGNEQKIMTEIRSLLVKTTTSEESKTATEEGPTAKADEIIAAAGGTSEGLLEYIDEGAKIYDELILVAELPYPEFQQEIKGFDERVAGQSNLFVKQLLPSLGKAREREFTALNRLAMLRAAMAYRLEGEAGFKNVQDPFGSGPFGFRRVENHANGQGRIVGNGFELSSGLINVSGPEKDKGKPMVMVFILKPATAK